MQDEFEDARDRLRQLHRNRPERRLAGVCAALSDQLEIPLPFVRAGFLIGAFVPTVNALVIVAYLVLWFVTPPALGERSGLDRAIDALRDLLGLDRDSAPRRSGSGASSDGFPTDPSV